MADVLQTLQDEYVVSGTTDSNGDLTLYITDTGLTGGTLLFSQIDAVIAVAHFGSASNAVDMPFACVKDSSPSDNKTVIIKTIKGKTLVALGATMQNAGSVEVTVIIHGTRA